MGHRELRRAKRIPKRQGAWVTPAADAARLPCTVWDISEQGARLAVPRPKSLPATFVLLLTHDGRMRRCCRIVWRTGAQVGVQFVAELDGEQDRPWRRVQAPAAPAEKRIEPLQPTSAPVPMQLLRVAGPAPGGHRGRGIFSLLSTVLGLAVFAGAVMLLVAQFYPDQGQIPWVSKVCSGTNIFCAHPILPGITALIVILVLIAAKRMNPE